MAHATSDKPKINAARAKCSQNCVTVNRYPEKARLLVWVCRVAASLLAVLHCLSMAYRLLGRGLAACLDASNDCHQSNSNWRMLCYF